MGNSRIGYGEISPVAALRVRASARSMIRLGESEVVTPSHATFRFSRAVVATMTAT